MGTVTILEKTIKDPISFIGECSGICWRSNTTDKEKNYKRGLECITSNHGRTIEFPDIYTVIDDYSARVIREWYTHIGCLPTRLQESTRYIDYANFGAIIPKSISENEEAEKVYTETIEHIRQSVQYLEKCLKIPREDSAMLLPMAMETRIVDKRNARNVIDMSRNRMCQRANWEYRQLFHDYIEALRQYSDEWRELVDLTMHPKCVEYGYCQEKKSCGRYPKKES